MAFSLIQFKRMLAAFFLMGAIIITTALPALCADYYVDGNYGSDNGTGTMDSPWKTITHALRHARNSDTVYIKYATYNESVNMAMVPIRGVSLIGLSQDGKRPVIHSASPDKHAIFLVNYHGTIKGLDVTGATNAVGINCVANGGNNTADISDCHVYGNNMGLHATTVGGGSPNCSPVIHNNHIYSNNTRGVGNMGHATAIIEYNFIYKNGSGEKGNGGIGCSDNSAPRIIGNVIYANNDVGISATGTARPEVINNTIYNHNSASPLAEGVRFGQDGEISSGVVLNNIIVHNAYGLVAKFGRHLTGNDYNDIWGNLRSDYIGFKKGVHDISANPLFVNVDTGDFHLQAGSPCIDKAETANAPARDIDGIQRPQGQASDMGAYEYSTIQIPVPPHMQLSVSGLTVTVSWNQVPDATKYILFYAPPDISYIGSADMDQRTTFSKELWPGAAFYVAIKACNIAGCSDFSNIEYFELAGEPPAEPLAPF